MGWLTTYDDTNKITDEIASRTEYTTILVGFVYVSYTRTVTETKYRYVAMTRGAADTAQAALLAATPAGTTRQCVARRNGPADGYDVEVYDIIYGEWAAV